MSYYCIVPGILRLPSKNHWFHTSPPKDYFGNVEMFQIRGRDNGRILQYIPQGELGQYVGLGFGLTFATAQVWSK